MVRESTTQEEEEEQSSNDETSSDDNAAELNNVETEVQGQVGQSDNLARDFNTGNLVNQFDELEDEPVNQHAQFNNNVEEVTAEDEDEDEDEDEEE